MEDLFYIYILMGCELWLQINCAKQMQMHIPDEFADIVVPKVLLSSFYYFARPGPILEFLKLLKEIVFKQIVSEKEQIVVSPDQ